MGNVYTLTFVNHSDNNWDFCCYQEDPDIGAQGVMSLAWFAFPVAPTTSVSFSWTIDYQFVWSQTGVLAPGVRFSASQKWPADLVSSNRVDFQQLSNKALTFQNQGTFGTPGTLYIDTLSVPANLAAVGINMGIEGSPAGAGSGTFVVPAQPNILASFTPHPTYWVTFGKYVAGQVLDTQQVTNKAPVAFPPYVYEMCAVLGPDNLWTIAPQQHLNAAFIRAGGAERFPHALLADPRFLK